MIKVTLDKNMFKALASETRLDILRNLDGKKLTLKDISNVTNLNKATLHEHLFKLHKAGLVKRREREGHKWVYYKLSWKGNSLLHPENNRIVVMFSATFITLFIGIISIINYLNYYFLSTRGSDLILPSKSEQINDSFFMVGKETPRIFSISVILPCVLKNIFRNS